MLSEGGPQYLALKGEMETSRDPQSLVLDRLKFVEVCFRHFGEVNESGVVEDGAHNGFVSGHQSLL